MKDNMPRFSIIEDRWAERANCRLAIEIAKPAAAAERLRLGL